MPSEITLRRAAVRPFVVEVHSGTSGLNMMNVTAVSLSVNDRGGAPWPTTLSNQSSSQLTATCMCPNNECPGVGTYIVIPLLTVSGQSWASEAEEFNLRVK